MQTHAHPSSPSYTHFREHRSLAKAKAGSWDMLTPGTSGFSWGSRAQSGLEGAWHWPVGSGATAVCKSVDSYSEEGWKTDSH